MNGSGPNSDFVQVMMDIQKTIEKADVIEYKGRLDNILRKGVNTFNLRGAELRHGAISANMVIIDEVHKISVFTEVITVDANQNRLTFHIHTDRQANLVWYLRLHLR